MKDRKTLTGRLALLWLGFLLGLGVGVAFCRAEVERPKPKVRFWQKVADAEPHDVIAWKALLERREKEKSGMQARSLTGLPAKSLVLLLARPLGKPE